MKKYHIDLNKFRVSEQYRSELCTALYTDIHLRQKISNTLSICGAQSDEQEDIFQDCIVALFKKIINANYIETPENLVSYMCGMARNMYLSKLKVTARKTSAEEVFNEISEEVPTLSYYKIEEIMETILSQTTDSCKRVLMYWAGNYKMQEIAEMMNYKSEMMARKKKHECLQKLIKYFKSQPLLMQKLFDNE